MTLENRKDVFLLGQILNMQISEKFEGYSDVV